MKIATLVWALLLGAPLTGAGQDPASANYVIGPRDVLTITIFGEPDLTAKTYTGMRTACSASRWSAASKPRT